MVETMNPCVGFSCTNRQNPSPTRARENVNDIALLEFEKNLVEFRKKRASVMEMRKKSDGLNNGVMLRFPPGSSVTVRVRPHNVLGSNRKSGSKSPKIGSPPYVYFRFGRQRPLDDGFAVFRPVWPPTLHQNHNESEFFLYSQLGGLLRKN